MGALSKEQEQERKKNELVRVIFPAVFLNVISGSMLFTARQAVAEKNFSSPAELATFLSKLASAGAAFEFLTNPIFGKLADKYGRRPIIPVGNMATMTARALLFMNPDKKWPLVFEQLLCIPLVTTFFSTFRATLGDHLEGAAFAEANAKIGMAAGLALVTGPLVTKAVMSRGDAKYCYLLSTIFSTTCFLHLRLNYKESLPMEKRRPLEFGDMQPLSFMRLMKDSVLRRLMLITGMQTFSEGRNITDSLTIYLQNEVKWTWDKINNFVSIYGMALILSGLTVKGMITKLGLIKFTTFSNMVNLASLLSYAQIPPLNSVFSPSQMMYLAVLFGAPGGRKRDAAESLIMKIGNDKGFGNGFISGSMMNFRAIINIFGPLMFGSLYAWGTRRKYPQVLFLAAAATILAAEASLRSLSHEELGLDSKGQVKKPAAKGD